MSFETSAPLGPPGEIYRPDQKASVESGIPSFEVVEEASHIVSLGQYRLTGDKEEDIRTLVGIIGRPVLIDELASGGDCVELLLTAQDMNELEVEGRAETPPSGLGAELRALATRCEQEVIRTLITAYSLPPDIQTFRADFYETVDRQ